MRSLSWLCMVILGAALLCGLWSMTGGPLKAVVDHSWSQASEQLREAAER